MLRAGATTVTCGRTSRMMCSTGLSEAAQHRRAKQGRVPRSQVSAISTSRHQVRVYEGILPSSAPHRCSSPLVPSLLLLTTCTGRLWASWLCGLVVTRSGPSMGTKEIRGTSPPWT
jgi:hypothetical protein